MSATGVGRRIRIRREELKLSQEELAAKLQYKSKSTIAKIENGNDDLSQSKLVKFARALDTTPGWLLGADKNVRKFLDNLEPFEMPISTHFLVKENEKKETPIDMLEKRIKDVLFEVEALKGMVKQRENFLDIVLGTNDTIKNAIKNTTENGKMTMHEVEFSLSKQRIEFLSNAIIMTIEQARMDELSKQGKV